MIKMVEEQTIQQLSAYMEEITATAHKLGALAEELKNKLTKYEVV